MLVATLRLLLACGHTAEQGSLVEGKLMQIARDETGPL
jgi:hypothetical protein